MMIRQVTSNVGRVWIVQYDGAEVVLHADEVHDLLPNLPPAGPSDTWFATDKAECGGRAFTWCGAPHSTSCMVDLDEARLPALVAAETQRAQVWGALWGPSSDPCGYKWCTVAAMARQGLFPTAWMELWRLALEPRHNLMGLESDARHKVRAQLADARTDYLLATEEGVADRMAADLARASDGTSWMARNAAHFAPSKEKVIRCMAEEWAVSESNRLIA